MAVGTLEPPVAVAPGVFVVPSIDPRSLTDGQLGEQIVAAFTARERATHVLAALVGEFEARGAYRQDGALTPKAWLEHKLRVSPGDATMLRRLGRTVRELPAVAEAFAAGATTARHVDLIGRAVAKHGADAIGEFTPTLLPAATAHRPRYLKALLDRIDAGLDPDGAMEAELRR